MIRRRAARSSGIDRAAQSGLRGDVDLGGRHDSPPWMMLIVAGVSNVTSVISAVHCGFGQASAPEGFGGAPVVSVGKRKLPFLSAVNGPKDPAVVTSVS